MTVPRLGLVASSIVLLPALSWAAPPASGELLRAAPGTVIPPAPRNDFEVLPRREADSRAMMFTEEQRVVVELKIPVKSIRVTGVKALPDAEIQALVAGAKGRQLTFRQLQGLVDRVTNYYRDRGYFLARAYLPAQRIPDGQIEIAVNEGRLGKLDLKVDPSSDTDSVRPYFSDLRPGVALQSEPLERDLLILSDVPGLTVQSLVKPGEEAGTSDVEVKVVNDRQWHKPAQFDNYGSRYTGEYRLTGSLSRSSLWRFGDRVDASFTTSGRGYNLGKLGWQMPYGADGTVVGAGASLLHYKLIDGPAIDSQGWATDLNVFASRPLLRSQQRNILARLSFDLKHFADDYGVVVLPADIQVAQATLVANQQLGNWGTVQGSAAFSLGHVMRDSQSGTANEFYTKIGYQGDYVVPLAPATSAAVRLLGQMAFKNLDSSEKLALSGPGSVRAYGSGEISVDDGRVLTLELRQNFGDYQGKFFFDSGSGKPDHTGGSLNAAGWGLGVDTVLPYTIQMQAAVAFRTTDVIDSFVDRRPRLWFLLSKSF